MSGKNVCPYLTFSLKLKDINKLSPNIPHKTGNSKNNNILDLNPSFINIVLII